MREGRIVEMGTRDEVIRSPKQAYTKELLDAVPEADPHRKRIVAPAVQA
jgi:ABC-type oligopeptide transport system ATPase subunit